MRSVIQRVSEAKVDIENSTVGQIKQGFLILLGIENADTTDDAVWLANKVSKLRVFNDPEGVMNLDIQDAKGNILVISQFTLHAKTKKGNRPSYIKAGEPSHAKKLYEEFIKILNTLIQPEVQSGEFGANMQVSLVNDGPVTLIIDTKNKE